MPADPATNTLLAQILAQLQEFEDLAKQPYSSIGSTEVLTAVVGDPGDNEVRAANENAVKTVVQNLGAYSLFVYEDGALVGVVAPESAWFSYGGGIGAIAVVIDPQAPVYPDRDFILTGPISVLEDVESAPFTIRRLRGVFNGVEKIQIDDNNNDALLTSSLGPSDIGVLEVTPPVDTTSFTFTVTSSTVRDYHIAATSLYGMVNPPGVMLRVLASGPLLPEPASPMTSDFLVITYLQTPTT